MKTLPNLLKELSFTVGLLFVVPSVIHASPMLYSSPDKVSSQASLIGKVFNDIDGDGYQDINEDGIPGVRLATVTGLVITTDGNGRYHVPESFGETQSWGRNFILKMDNASLPIGSVVTTENPRVVRFANSGLSKVNFGVQLP